MNDLDAQFRQVARQGRRVCEQLERGQAEMPLAQHFDTVLEGLDRDPLTIVLLGLSPEARGSALGWLCGHDFRVFSVQVPDVVGLVEVQLHERGYVLESADGSRQEFDRLEPFLEAMQNADLVRPGDDGSLLDPLRVRVAAPQGVQGLLIIMPESTRALVRSPSMLSQIVRRANLALVVGAATHTPADDDRRALADLEQAFDVLWPIVVTDDAPPRTGWWRSIRGAAGTLPAVTVAECATGDLPELLADPAHPLRRGLFLRHHATQLESAAALVADRQAQERRQLSARQSSIVRRAKTLEAAQREGDVRVEIEDVRAFLQSEMSKLTEGVGDQNRKAMLPTGDLPERIRGVVATLEPDDLKREPTARAIKLTLDDAFQNRVSQSAKEGLRAQLKRDLVTLRDGLEALRDDLAGRLQAVRGAGVSLELALPDDKTIWDAMREMINVEIRYRGEMPKRSFFKRLGEGRRMVFAIMMMLPILTLSSEKVRDVKFIPYLILALFVAGAAYTFITWRREDEDRIDKEMDRVRDAVASEAKRLLAEVQREKLSRIAGHMTEAQREASRRIDAIARETADARSDQAGGEQRQLREKGKLLERRARELAAFGQDITKLQQACRELSTASRSVVADQLRAIARSSG